VPPCFAARVAIEALEVVEREVALLEQAEQQRAHIIDSAYAEAAALSDVVLPQLNSLIFFDQRGKFY
jgi:hypothetical protein